MSRNSNKKNGINRITKYDDTHLHLCAHIKNPPDRQGAKSREAAEAELRGRSQELQVRPGPRPDQGCFSGSDHVLFKRYIVYSLLYST